MQLIAYAYAIVSMAIVIAYINARYIKMQTTVAVMVASLLLSLYTLLLHQTDNIPLTSEWVRTIQSIDFSNLLLNGFLGFLLFAGSLSVELQAFKELKWDIGILATLSTIVSTILIGFACYYGLEHLGPMIGITPQPLVTCLIFGALISPTDPIAVLATLKQLNAPPKLTTRLAGESLFNDGVGIVLFLVLFNMAYETHQKVTLLSTLTLFLQQACGGLLAGYLVAKVYKELIRDINDNKMAILLTLAIVTGGYHLIHHLGLSAPLAMVVSGILIGQYAKETKGLYENLHSFWEIIDEILNIILFFLLGFEMILVDWSTSTILVMTSVIPLVLMTRWLTVSVPMMFLKTFRQIHPMATKILVWGGLRGGLSVALALSLPNSPDNTSNSLILAMTFAVVLFSMLVQASTIPALVKKTKE